MVSLPRDQFRFCPRCGEAGGPPAAGAPFRCSACGWVYFFNPAVAAGVFLRDPGGRVLFIRRAKDPARGKLALPGGFIDYDETAEAGLAREVREEIGLELGAPRFVCSQVNQYHYQGVTYPVVDLFFTTAVPPGAVPQALDGVDGWCWREPNSVDLDELAFPSIRAAFVRLRAME